MNVFPAVFDVVDHILPREKKRYLSLIAVRALANILDVAGLFLIGVLATSIASFSSSSGSEEPLVLWGLSVQTSEGLVVLLACAASLFVMKSLLSSVLLRQTQLFLAGVEARIAIRIANLLFSGTLQDLKKVSRGDIQWSVQTSPRQAISGLLNSVAIVLNEALLLGLIVSLFLFVDFWTTIYMVGYFCLFLLVSQLVVSRKVIELGERMAETSVSVTNKLDAIVGSFREAFVIGSIPSMLAEVAERRRLQAEATSLQLFYLSFPRYLLEAALMVGVFLLVAGKFMLGDFETGLVTVAVFLTGGLKVMAALMPLQNAINNIRYFAPQASGAIELLKQQAKSPLFLSETPHPSQFKDADPNLPDGPVSVELSRVSFTHKNPDVRIFEGFSLQIRDGAHIGIIGPSGSGKSSLADLILGVNRPDEGLVSVGGLPVEDFVATYPGALSYVPQVPAMVPGTVANNVALGKSGHEIDYDQVESCLAKAGLLGFVDSLPNRVHTELGNHYDALSGGQRQRLGLARALYSSPRLLVLDEATSALDAETEFDVTKSLDSLREKVTLVVIAHRLATVAALDRIVVLENGFVVGDGRFEELKKSIPFVEKYIELNSDRL